ncbi:hypothetical protein H9P43_002530 [Blastocladiella emersonii ATCC 22665]|nr:hypothetical protein H9P43_002530 [Blastocladiella emersonii ATCC 22665]
MSKKPAGGGAAAAANAKKSKDPNVLYPPRDVPIPLALPEARRITVSAHDLGPHFSAGTEKKLSTVVAAETKRKQDAQRRLAESQQQQTVAAPSPAESKLGVPAPAAGRRGSVAPPPAAPPAAAKAAEKAPARKPSGAAAGAAKGKPADAAGGSASRRESGGAAAPASFASDPALADVFAKLPSIPFRAPKPNDRPLTPPAPLRPRVLDAPTDETLHPADPSIRVQYSAARRAHLAWREGQELESEIPFDSAPPPPPTAGDLLDASVSTTTTRSLDLVVAANAEGETVAERKWWQLVAWEDAQAARLWDRLDGAVLAFQDAVDRCMDDHWAEQDRIGDRILAQAARIRNESPAWPRDQLLTELETLRELVTDDAYVFDLAESELAWHQEDAAGRVAESVDRFRARILVLPGTREAEEAVDETEECDNADRGGEPVAAGLAALIPSRARSLQLLAHRELVRASIDLLRVRQEASALLLGLQVSTTRRFHDGVQPVVAWVYAEWPLARARHIVDQFRATHTSREWVRNVAQRVVAVLDALVVRCRHAAQTPTTPGGARRRSSEDPLDASFAEAPPLDLPPLPLAIDAAAVEDAVKNLNRFLSAMQHEHVGRVTAALKRAVRDLLEAALPWPGQLTDFDTLTRIASVGGVTVAELEPWWIGRALAADVRRPDWVHFLYLVGREATAAVETLADTIRVARRYARCLHEQWAMQQAEMARVRRTLEQQLAESQHVHDDDVAKHQRELDRQLRAMAAATTESECVAVYDTIKAILSELEYAYSSRARQINMLVSGTDEGAVSKFDGYQQRWSEMIVTDSIDPAVLRAKIASFEQSKRPSHVGFAERARGPGVVTIREDTSNNASPTPDQSAAAAAARGPSYDDDLSVSFTGKPAASKKKRGRAKDTPTPTAINFQRPSGTHATPSTDAARGPASPAKSPATPATGPLNTSSLDGVVLGGNYTLGPDVCPRGFTLDAELDAIRVSIHELVQQPMAVLQVALTSHCTAYRAAFETWRDSTIATLTELEKASLARTANLVHAKGYAHEQRGRQLQHTFTQRLLAIQATKQAARKQAKDREGALVALAEQWRAAVETAEGILQSHLQKLVADHDVVTESLTLVEVERRKRAAAATVAAGTDKASKLIGPLQEKWAALSAELNAVLEQANQDSRSGTPDGADDAVPRGYLGNGGAGPAISGATAGGLGQVKVLTVQGLEGKLTEVTAQFREGAQRVAKLRARLNESLTGVQTVLTGYAAELEVVRNLQTALGRAKTRLRSTLLADQAAHAAAMADLRARLDELHAHGGNEGGSCNELFVVVPPSRQGKRNSMPHVVTTSGSRRSSRAQQCAADGHAATAADEPSTQDAFWQSFCADVVRVVEMWNAAAARNRVLGIPAQPIAVPKLMSWSDVSALLTAAQSGGSETGTKSTNSAASSRTGSGEAKSRGSGTRSKRGSVSFAGTPTTASTDSAQPASPSRTADAASMDSWLQTLDAELAQVCDTLVPRRQWATGNRSWSMVDSIVAAAWAAQIRSEMADLVAQHHESCVRDLHYWQHTVFPSLAQGLLDRGVRRLGKWIALEWQQLRDAAQARVQAANAEDQKARRARWDGTLRAWRPGSTEPQARRDPSTVAAEWLGQVLAENAAWTKSALEEGARQHMRELGSRCRTTDLASLVYLAMLLAPLTHLLAAATEGAAIAMTPVPQWLSVIPDMTAIESTIHAAAAATTIAHKTVLAKRVLTECRALLETISTEEQTLDLVVCRAVDAAQADLQGWLAGWTGALDLMRSELFHIGVNLPFTTPSLGRSITGIVDFLKLNAPDLARLDPTGTHNFSLVYTPTNYTDVAATQALLHAVLDEGVVAIVGDLASSHTIPAALAGARTKTWICSGFMRTMATDPAQGEILAHLVRSMGWATASVISSSDSYGSSVSTAFVTRATQIGITISANQVFQLGQADLTGVLKAIQAGGSRIIVAAVFTDDGTNLLRQAKAHGMINADTVWLGPEVWGMYIDTAISDDDIQSINGLMYVMPREDSFNTQYNASLARWNAAYPDVPVATYSYLFQDCVTTIARGILSTVADVGTRNFLAGNYQPNMTKHFLVPFEGVSGAVQFTAEGDRKSFFSVYNYWDGKRTLVYEVNPDLNVVPKAPPRFFSGSSAIPRDRPEQTPLFARWNQSSGMGLAIVNGLLIALILASNVYLYTKRTVPAVKHLSFPFLTLICAGCVLVLSSNLAALGQQTTMSCQLSLWLFVYGVELVLASSAAKAYRIWSIFDNKAMVSLSRVGNQSLFLGVGCIMLVQTCLLAIWSGAGPQIAQLVSQTTYFYYDCQSASVTFHKGLAGATLAYNFFLLVVLTYLAFKTRKVASGYRESTWLFYVSQNFTICGIVVGLFAFFSFGESTLAAFVVKQVIIIYATFFTFSALVGRLVYRVYPRSGPARLGGGRSGLVGAGNNGSGIVGGGSGHAHRHGSSHHGHAGSNHGHGGTGSGIAPANASSSATSRSGLGANIEAALAPPAVRVATTESNGKVTHARGVYPVKRHAVFATWVNHTVVLNVVDGQLTLIPAKVDPEHGAAIRVALAMIDLAPPGMRHCIEVTARGTTWLIQLSSEDEVQQWAALFATCLGGGSGAAPAVHGGIRVTLSASNLSGGTAASPMSPVAAASAGRPVTSSSLLAAPHASAK